MSQSDEAFRALTRDLERLDKSGLSFDDRARDLLLSYDIEPKNVCHNHPDRTASVEVMDIWWCHECHWDIRDGYGPRADSGFEADCKRMS